MKKITNIFNSLWDNNKVHYDISYRGGTLGVRSGDLVDALFPDKSDTVRDNIINGLPNMVGVYCNYLGGGLRGSVSGSSFSPDLPKYATSRISDFIALCKKRYIAIEGSMNDEVDADGDTNWDAVGTNASRNAGIVSAY